MARIETPRRVRGTQDIFGDEQRRFATVIETFERVRRLYCFQRVDLPVFEATEVFARSIGETTDVVSKEMYTFPDRGGDMLTLRHPDGGFRRLRIVQDGRGLVSADGAEEAKLVIIDKGLIEAAASGCALVTTDVPGCRDVVHDEANGLLVRVRDAVDLADKLARLVADPELRRRMGAAGRVSAELNFSSARSAEQTLDIYRELI